MPPGLDVHPRWEELLQWLASLGMQLDELKVVACSSPGAGFGMFASQDISPGTPLFTIPAKALMNHKTLRHLYPKSSKLSCTQIVSMHLMLHRPLEARKESNDPHFGPHISVLPGEFDWHPVTWSWKASRARDGSSLERRLISSLPPSVADKIDEIGRIYSEDWRVVSSYMKNQLKNDLQNLNEESFLWGWLNVNTRCIYKRLEPVQSDKNNMTLCPILDFANHTSREPFVRPRPTNARSKNGPPKKSMDSFVLKSPTRHSVASGEQLFLRYGEHPNSTLFAEYGFVEDINWADTPETFATCQIDSLVEQLFTDLGSFGAWMKDVLVADGYWGDWTMQTAPAPAHPSYRLITALRLYNLVSPEDQALPLPSISEQLLVSWRNTTLGYQDSISSANEVQWRGTLLRLCNTVTERAKSMLDTVEGLGKQPQKGGLTSPEWVETTKQNIATLWYEESHVALAVIKSLEDSIMF